MRPRFVQGIDGRMHKVAPESLEEFIQRQGCEYVTVNGTGGDRMEVRLLFANGAVASQLDLVDPPQDKQTLAELRHQFVKVKLEMLTAEYEGLKSWALDQQAYHLRFPLSVPSAEGSIESLRSLQAQIIKLEDEQAELEMVLVTDFDRDNEKRTAHELMEQERMKASRVMSQIAES